MTESLVRIVGTGDCTEINATRFGRIVPDADNAIRVPQECVVDCEKAGFRRRELTTNEKLLRISDLASDLPEPDRIAIQTAISSQQLLVWRAMRPDLATSAAA
jgi:hypothetical protein